MFALWSGDADASRIELPERSPWADGTVKILPWCALGPERGLFRIDFEHLFIEFDPTDRVQRVWLYTD